MNVEGLLTPIASDAPSGPNLEYDRAFAELERTMAGKPERQIGETVVEAEEPDWRAAQAHATELLARTKDLRVAVHLLRATLKTGGLAAFSAGLALLRGLVERYWATLHPQLDPDDDNDPTMRVNILMSLCDAPMLAAVRATPLVSSRAFGRFGLRDLEIAAGELPAPATNGASVADAATIDGSFADADLTDLQATAEAARAVAQNLAVIETLVNEQVGAERGPSFAALIKQVKRADEFLTERLFQRGVTGIEESSMGATANGATASEENGNGAETSGQPRNGQASGDARAPTRRSSLSGEVNSREDVLRALDKIIDYYQRSEPSSPIPILMRRSKRLVAMGFLDIVRDIAPDALSQVELLRGREEGSG